MATPLLLVAALIVGSTPAADRGDTGSAIDLHGQETSIAPDAPPLDVLTPLAGARRHAFKAVLDWIVALTVVTIIATPTLRLLGWPTVAARVVATVVDVRDRGEQTRVSFEATHRSHVLRWSIDAKDPGWERGDRRVVLLDDDGRVHLDEQLGLAALPLLMPVGLIGMFAILATRRAWGLVVALWDAQHGDDEPTLGYAALIHAPRTIRPLLAIWERDPTGSRLARADAVYRADEVTGEELESWVSDVIVRRAWIDRGPWRRAKPRWVGFEDGVAVPHRRALLGRWYLRVLTNRASVSEVVPLHHGPPDLRAVPTKVGEPDGHRLGRMVAWRTAAVVPAIALAFTTNDAGIEVRAEGAPAERVVPR